jgi:hypothetical protein
MTSFSSDGRTHEGEKAAGEEATGLIKQWDGTDKPGDHN